MANIPDNYPHGLKDQDIENSIKEYSQEIARNSGNPLATSIYSPLIQLGQSELQNRQTKKTLILTMIVSFTSLFIAGAALYVTYQASVSSNHWERSQIEILSKIENNTEGLGPKIISSLNTVTTSTLKAIDESTNTIVKSIEKQDNAMANK